MTNEGYLKDLITNNYWIFLSVTSWFLVEEGFNHGIYLVVNLFR